MSDIKDTTNSDYDDDFHFDEVDPSDDVSFGAPKSSTESSVNQKSNLGKDSFFDDSWDVKNKWNIQPKNSRKLIVFGVVIAIILFFIFYHFTSSWNNPFSGLHHDSSSKRQSGAASLPSAAQIAREEQQAKAAAFQAQIEGFENKSNTLDQTLSQQQQTINQLQANMGTLQDSVNTLNGSVDALAQKFDTLDSKLTKPVKQVSKAEPAAAPPITYIIRAMVPGRAWLQSSNGISLSVASGNEVQGHGTVTDIDLSAGQVTMSDGSVFAYDTNGN